MTPYILLNRDAANFMLSAAIDAGDEETGGILVGHYEDSNLVVTHAIVVAPTKPAKDRYLRSDASAEIMLQRYLRAREHDDPAGYIGEWHSHPGESGPSDIDMTAVREIAAVAGRRLSLLVVRPQADSVFAGVIAAVSHRKKATAVAAAVKVYPPTSSRGDTANPVENQTKGRER